jgi:hypothetical protein
VSGASHGGEAETPAFPPCELPLPAEFGLAGRLAAVALTFHFVCVGWVLFVLDAETAGSVILRLLGMA